MMTSMMVVHRRCHYRGYGNALGNKERNNNEYMFVPNQKKLFFNPTMERIATKRWSAIIIKTEMLLHSIMFWAIPLLWIVSYNIIIDTCARVADHDANAALNAETLLRLLLASGNSSSDVNHNGITGPMLVTNNEAILPDVVSYKDVISVMKAFANSKITILKKDDNVDHTKRLLQEYEMNARQSLIEPTMFIPFVRGIWFLLWTRNM